MNELVGKLPEFDNPPLQETILSVEFDRIAEMKIPHYGAFWAAIRSDYPVADTQPPLAPAPSDSAVPVSLRLSAGDINLARACFTNNHSTMQVQLQNDRFLTTWSRGIAENVYPRYTKTRKNFEEKWEIFRTFLKQEQLPAPRPTRCEITYVNHIGPTGDWSELPRLEDIFAPWSGSQTDGFLQKPNIASVLAQYSWPQGELTVALQPAIRVADQKKLVQLILTARLPLRDGTDTPSILNCFDIGREWIVRGFADLTTRTMQSVWKRKD